MAHLSHMIFPLTALITLLLGGLLWPDQALCRLSAEAGLNYINYDVRDNSQHLSANALTQRYSLLYQKTGKIYDKRIGNYDLSLGYDWSILDSTIKSTDGALNSQVSRGSFRYQGSILIDPKEIPLRFTAYSRDMGRSSFTQNLNIPGNDTVLGNPGVATGIMGAGMHIDSGATLTVGVKNGMTNGYNELLRHFPMLLLDYTDTINRDLSGDFPVDNRSSRLAFVSLNKKDNWFHYRVLTYDDYITPANNTKETQFQLGTIDQAMQRRWIDFANWLQVSADGQLTRRTAGVNAEKSELLSSSYPSSSNSTEFNLNLFAIAQRSTWEARTFNSFNRHHDGNGKVTYQTSTPIYASGSWSADTSWNTRFSYKEIHDNKNNQFTDITGGYRIYTFKKANFNLTQSLDLEKASSNSTELVVVSGGLETTSSTRFSRVVSLAASYNIQNNSTNSNTGTSNFLNQSLTVNAAYTPSDRIRLLLQQANQITNGTSKEFVNQFEGSAVSSSQYIAPDKNTSVNGSTFRSTTALNMQWNPLPRFDIGFSVSEDIYIPTNSPRTTNTNFTNTINYSSGNLRLTSTNSFATGSNNSQSFSNRNSANYAHNRNLNTSIKLTYNKYNDFFGKTDSLSIEESLNYYYYMSGVRKLFEINEKADYSENNTNTNNSSFRIRSSNLSLGAKYYPIRVLVMGAGVRYSFINGFNYSSAAYYASLGLNFKLLQASLDYYYGNSKSDGRIEKKFTANVRKTF